MANFVARASRLRTLRAAVEDVQAKSSFAFSFAGKNGRRDACPTRLTVGSHGELCGAGVSPAHALGGNRDVQVESGFACSFAGKNGRRDACPTRLTGILLGMWR